MNLGAVSGGFGAKRVVAFSEHILLLLRLNCYSFKTSKCHNILQDIVFITVAVNDARLVINRRHY